MSKVMYVILNGSLNMSAGKSAAQTAHAVASLPTSRLESFVKDYRRTVIVLSASGGTQMNNILDYLYEAGIKAEGYVDEGVNEVEAFSFTAIAVEPIEEDDERTRQIFSALPLYPAKKEVNLKLEAYKIMKDVELEQFDGWNDNLPWYVKRTIRWLEKNK